ncbi:DNA replication endonuclease-helicase Dna2 [Exophiala dermatitidis]|nr:DNA replication endonuclease-helicase Dna2 [Exophiala dermatitidis]KAJ4514135.1 DNA replication endonuclease-helicase Dna2 [Exophiala dermatitidis]KAJ4515381.1 DNA replication endonuclease-helicase Dna2 [Exophiala dermatitidis]KAJ4533783.1 DNA replication endonuclease-helicase Dna2 [Exophiala dermatitidis]KAJ4540908.1 DNA replication endonuclease-helicase Dna2 [Exophiala dermatitidis]
MPSAPYGISSQSRKKLKAFAFDSRLLGEEADKENQSLGKPGKDGDGKEEEIIDVGDKHLSQNVVPRTPAVRIPFEDLIANTEDAFNCLPPIATPKDHVLWETHPDSTDISGGAATQGSRKRARSSSPVSSQLGRSDQIPVQKDALNLDALNKSLRTPNHDPTQDLWNRYTTANTKKAEQAEPTLPQYAHLLPSSPQTPSTASKDGGLRRTHSCGTEWPTSKAKRRRVETNEFHGRTKELFAASRKEILRRDLSNNTKVGLLLEKIQESLAKKVPVDESPSSSSPLPDRRSQPSLSPTKQQFKTRPDTTELARPPVNEPAVTSQGLGHQQDASSSSEFSDDGLDIEAFESVEQALAENAAPNDTVTAQAPCKSAVYTREVDSALLPVPSLPQQTSQSNRNATNRVLPEPPPPEPPTLTTPQEFDGFDDEDEELMNEMLDLAAQYDSQHNLTLKEPSVIEGADAEPEPDSKHLETLDEFEDAFDDDDELWEGIAAATSAKATGAVSPTKQNTIDNRAIKRYMIVDVIESEFEYKPGRKRPEKMLSVKDEKTGMLYIVLLRESWYDTRCTKGSYIHIIGKFDRRGQCIINDANNMIILHPDHLISSTVVGDAFMCMRRAVLQDRIKTTSVATQPQVYGYILHEVFGQALRLNKWDTQTFKDIIDKILPSYIEPLYEIGVQVQDAKEYVLGKAPELMAWASVFVGDELSPDAVIRDRNGLLVPTTINKLLEIEEHIWSPMYGLKGNIDATVQAQMKLPHEQSARTLLVPFELKTGKRDNVEQHRVQTALYTLLLSDRYDINVTCGVLYYMETSKTFRVEGVRNEIRHMIIERNELACYVHDKLALPPMKKKEHLCKSCYIKASCFIYHKLSENGDGETSGLGEKFNEVVDHLSPEHQAFFKKWDDLLTQEERDTMKFRRELWTMLSSEREAVGRCFSEVIIQPGSARENPSTSKINRYEYTFVKHQPRPGFSFAESQITTGEPIVISDEKGHFNFAAGFVTNVRPTYIVVAVDRKLQRARRKLADFDSSNRQIFSGVIEEHDRTRSASGVDEGPILYRIDKDEFANGMATARNNVIRMMEKDLWRARELRQLIIENKPPDFKVTSTGYSLSGPASQQSLNIDQQKAIEKVMSARDYALVLGMPGTGKTTTIAHIIRALVSQGKSVLLASYTHTAVDNILLKIKEDHIPILRIGAVNKVHPDIQSFADVSGVPKRTIEELHASWHGSKVVATTCLGVNHGIFNARTFDYCIVDEASQITLPVCLGPIRMARTFVLVGDHYQLPPLVQNKQAQEGGLDVSLFKLLSDAQPDSVVNLEHQYRMAEDIMLLSKELVYSGRIKCGNEAVANRMLHIPDLEGGLAGHHFMASSLPNSRPGASSTGTQVQTICASKSSCWLRRAISPTSRCLFLNTDTMSTDNNALAAFETSAGARTTNTVESYLAAQLVATLIHSGVPPRSIGVITFYRSQLALLKSDVKSLVRSAAVAADVEMHTADKYQGRDKEVVILSCVRSNANKHVGDLLKDWRRVNVAVTRARSKLLILGSKSTLQGSGVPILEGITRIMDQKGWVLDLPMGASDAHLFETGSQLTTAATNGAVPSQKSGSGSTADRRSKSKSPQKRKQNQTKTPLRTPNKVVRGSALVGDVHSFLDKRPVLRDVVNDSVGAAAFDGGLVGKENRTTLSNDVTTTDNGAFVDLTDDMDVDMDADFDPADFGVF